MELLLIRHGLPLRVQNESGEPANPPLSELGHEQAARMADWLHLEPIDRLYSSPMTRAHQTALPLSGKIGLDIELENGVAEYDQHADTYIPVEHLKELDYDRWLRLMRGETDIDFDAFSEQVITTLERLVAENAGKRIAVTCHGGVINVWTAHVIGFPPRLFFNPDYTSINRFLCARSGEKSVVALNEAPHLRDVQG